MSKQKQDQVRVGVVGVGSMGAAHATMIAQGDVPGATLTAVCDIDASALAGFSQVETFEQASAMIASGVVDAVVVAVPHYAHVDLAVEALQAGLHVLVEKPLAVTTAEAKRILDAHEARPRAEQVFGVMFNQRTSPTYAKLRSMIRDGELGTIQRVSWIITDWFRSEAYYRSGGWRATWAGEGGGVLVNQCPHQLDLWQWLFGMPSKVRAFAQFGADHDIEVEDRVTAYMEYEDGMTGTFIASTGEFPGSNRLEVACDRGKVVIDTSRDAGGGFRFLRTEVPVSEHNATTPERFKGPEHWDVTIPVSGKGEQHKGICKNFVAAILAEEPLLGPGVEGIHGVELANAMLYSAWTDQTAVLPVPADEYTRLLEERIASSRFVKKETVRARDDMNASF
ncbi:Gfo/Idh/MocA family protein [Mucisphaera calidilacus]|uniref:Glucose--fructose oxidoreductase n=1 Tax=Mucisphaera calidilacus TaxID=2527982 RepID=A0A518BYH2_9BACT|nr:Gfo/Idh/MocA family oxidoreductase [Mucisphaera calidilacus]QDU72021.1 Glucose--fructose oxidoreductase precursor [Mucisphaera calidilacus]